MISMPYSMSPPGSWLRISPPSVIADQSCHSEWLDESTTRLLADATMRPSMSMTNWPSGKIDSWLSIC